MASIRVVVTSVYEYDPDLDDNEYKAAGVYSVADALVLDEKDWKAGKVTLDELCYGPPKVTAEWSLVDD